MRGSKTTATDPVKKMVKILKKQGITNISYGIIISIKGRRDHRATIKHNSESGAHLLTITGKRYKQEFRIYDDVSREVILNILKDKLGEAFRILD
ncbi:MAG: hypothetical protein LR005_02125 [Candidatus Pacebacteria bacterium]|nr:hypothetical protein [Candidatus Paceibacterota bacterium]